MSACSCSFSSSPLEGETPPLSRSCERRCCCNGDKDKDEDKDEDEDEDEDEDDDGTVTRSRDEPRGDGGEVAMSSSGRW